MGELESIRVFLAVAEHRSFASAARQLGLTPASVTRTIATLEQSLGLQLVVRTTRQVSLTSAGAVYPARVAAPAQAIEDAADATREAQGVTAGPIRVTAPISLGVKVLPAVLSQFAVLNPRTHITLDLSDAFVDILEGNYDLAIRISGPPNDKSTIWRKLCKVPRILVTAPGYVQAMGPPRSPDDLAGLACLSCRADGGKEVWELTRGAHKQSFAAQGQFSANNGDVLARLVANGEGVALLPRFIVEDDLAAGRMVQLLPDWSFPDLWLTLYYPPYEKLPLRVATFSNFFETYVTETRPL